MQVHEVGKSVKPNQPTRQQGATRFTFSDWSEPPQQPFLHLCAALYPQQNQPWLHDAQNPVLLTTNCRFA
jgi:hypothetical protein